MGTFTVSGKALAQVVKAIKVNLGPYRYPVIVADVLVYSFGQDGLRFVHTNINTWLQQNIAADRCTGQIEPCLIPFKALVAATTKHKRHPFAITQKDGGLVFVVENTETFIPSIKPDDYPQEPTWLPSQTNQHRVSGDHLRGALERVAYARSEDKTRYTINGVAVDPIPNGTVLAATDGHRLARHSTRRILAGELGIQNERRVIPGDAVKLALVLLDDEPVTAHFEPKPTSLKESNVPCFRLFDAHRRFVVVSKVADADADGYGLYPEYEQVIPKPGKTSSLSLHCIAEREKLLAALESLNAPKSFRFGVKIDCNGEIKLDCKLDELVKASATAPAFDTPRPGVAVINPRYITEALAHLESARVEILRTAGDKPEQQPILIRGDADTIAVIMPVRE